MKRPSNWAIVVSFFAKLALVLPLIIMGYWFSGFIDFNSVPFSEFFGAASKAISTGVAATATITGLVKFLRDLMSDEEKDALVRVGSQAYGSVRGRLGVKRSENASSILTERFLAKSGQSAVLDGAVLLIFGIFAIHINEYGAGVCCVGLGLLVLAHRALTELRVQKGFFGANMDEAIELIEFALKEQDKTGGPPTKRVSRPYVVEDRSSAGVSGLTEGAR